MGMHRANAAAAVWATLLVSPLVLGTATSRALGQAAPAPSGESRVLETQRQLIEATHDRLVFDRDITRVAVGREETLTAEVLTSRELLVLGESIGSTSLVVWFADGSIQQFNFSVQPDLTVLREALAEIHPGIVAEVAPDREALVLRGTVPDVSYSTAAENAARVYLASNSGRGEAGITALVAASAEGDAAATVRPGTGNDARRRSERRDLAVINFIRLENFPLRTDEKIRLAIDPLVGDDVTVRRVESGPIPDDATDLFVLEGSVPDQVTLSRILFLASGIVLGDDADDGDRRQVRVLADESGGLADVDDLFGSANVGGGVGNIQLGGASGAFGGGGAQNSGLLLSNRIGANLGRAKVIEAAGGRVLALIDVEHLPLVRVDVRLYEVNLAKLRQWSNDIGIIGSDFDQNPLSPSPLAQTFQGTGASPVNPDDIQDVVGFLDGGLANQLQYVTGGFAIDNVFQLLVTEEIARALSRPTLTVLSGELAIFQVGGQVPIVLNLTVGGGTDQVLSSVEFIEFGVQLAVRPLVEEHGTDTMTLDITPRVSFPDFQLTEQILDATGSGIATTAFESRAARTHTRLRDGEAMMIGGLISSRDTSAQGKLPILGDIPGLGWLFRSETAQAEDLELVIVLNPVIVRPERPDAGLWAFPDPGDVLDLCLSQLEPYHPVREPNEGDETPENQEPLTDQRHFLTRAE